MCRTLADHFYYNILSERVCRKLLVKAVSLKQDFVEFFTNVLIKDSLHTWVRDIAYRSIFSCIVHLRFH